MHTFCNPVNINYQYQPFFRGRESASPAFGRHNGFACRNTLEGSPDGMHWQMLQDMRQNDNDAPHIYVPLATPLELRYLRLTNAGAVPANGTFAVSGLRVFGFGRGKAPETAPRFCAKRCEDRRNMEISWTAVPGAEGYIVRFGVDPQALHTHWQVIGETAAVIRCLIADEQYFVRVDAYNDSGYTAGTVLQTV